MIDIIIPVYNSGKNIARSLNSVLDQVNYKDICVYIVDDCSSEDYTDIINHFKKYLNITYLKLEKNSGPGVARNYGLDNSKSEYIVFLDSDDEFYSKDSVLKLYNSIEKYDVVFGKMQQEIKDQTIVKHHEGCLHGKMYRRSVLEKNHIRFHDIRIKGGNAHEDNAFNQLYLSCTHKVNYINDIIYKYKEVENSITQSENRLKSFQCYIKSMTWLFEQIEAKEHVENYYVGRVITSIIFYLYHNYLLYEEEYSFCFNELSILKQMYKKYTKYIFPADKLRIFKNFNYPVIPNITIDEFIDKIV